MKDQPPPPPDDEEEKPRRYVPPCHSANVPDCVDPASWTMFLPEPYCNNPRVVVYMVPTESKFMVRESTDPRFKGVSCVFAEFTRQEQLVQIPLAFVNKDYGNYIMQRKLIQEFGGRFGELAHTGLLHEIPQVCLMRTDWKPVMALWDAPHETMLDLQQYMTRLTKAANING